MSEPPAIFTRAKAALAPLVSTSGLVEVRSEYHEATFGSAYAEYVGAGRTLRLVWDGREGALFAEILVDGRWKDVESATSAVPPFDRDRSDERIARLLQAANEALSSRL